MQTAPAPYYTHFGRSKLLFDDHLPCQRCRRRWNGRYLRRCSSRSGASGDECEAGKVVISLSDVDPRVEERDAGRSTRTNVPNDSIVCTPPMSIGLDRVGGIVGGREHRGRTRVAAVAISDTPRRKVCAAGRKLPVWGEMKVCAAPLTLRPDGRSGSLCCCLYYVVEVKGYRRVFGTACATHDRLNFTITRCAHVLPCAQDKHL